MNNDNNGGKLIAKRENQAANYGRYWNKPIKSLEEV